MSLKQLFFFFNYVEIKGCRFYGICFCFQKWPYFGHYQSLREEKISEIKKQADLLAENLRPPLRSCYEPTKAVPAVKNVIGQALPMIGPYKGLDNKQQVVALIDDVSKLIWYAFRVNTVSLVQRLHRKADSNSPGQELQLLFNQ